MKTDFYKNVQKISGKDFSSIQEYFARPFESYVEDSLEKKTMKNTYLVAPNKMSKV
ncbi:LPD1 domain-containing protein [Leptospira mayottensis]|uniref:LPD1 domain-containing protein n=1 Tax=Leptospira mayottensis TaxID=1137606 RepID=UPI0020B1137B|nr:LPD1 domain-containing protein [Leptospira mayottensis]